MWHAVGAQCFELGQAELQRVEAEHVGDGLVEMALLPGEEVLSRRGLQPLGQLYDRAFRHEPDRRTRLRHAALDAQALAREDILVTHLHADRVGGWNSKFR